jgi:hypothetical protein
MKWTEEQITALKGSIEKWIDIIAGTGEDDGADNCPCCVAFPDWGCPGCPIAELTGEADCRGTPYKKWVRHHWAKHTDSPKPNIQCPTCMDLANEELAFLESTLNSGLS